MLCQIVCLTSSLIVCPVVADDGPPRQKVQVELKSQPEFILNAGPKGESMRSNIDSIIAITPPAIATAVNEWTGISDRGKAITVKFSHAPANASFRAMSSGDGHSETASVRVGERTLARQDTNVRYKEVFASCDEKSLSVLGIYEFENGVTPRKCNVICHIEGEKLASKGGSIHPTGTATWTLRQRIERLVFEGRRRSKTVS